ncbi:MAG: thioredoxin family protein [Terriglobia bacterium]|jgi:small redox-active disulfide protein 2
MNIKILGSGCIKCKELAHNVELAVAELKLPATIEKVTDIVEIVKYGILSTPALVVDGEVVSHGRVLNPSEAERLLKSAYGN